jgi:putative Mn2+ efflux pump MntP
MSFGKLFVVALTLSLNNFAVALALGALGHAKQRWRVAAAFGAFEFGVPLLGIWLGQQAAGIVAERAGWIGAMLLGLMGVWTLFTARRDRGSDERLNERMVHWDRLVVLAAGLSVDNLVVGLGLGLRGFPPLAMAATIAGSVLAFIFLGLALGSVARRHWEQRAEIAAGILLIGLAGAMTLGWI